MQIGVAAVAVKASLSVVAGVFHTNVAMVVGTTVIVASAV